MKRTTATFLLFLTLFTFFSGFILAKKAVVTYYAKRYNGRKTASGEIYTDKKLTCASDQKYFLGKHILFQSGKNKVMVLCNDLMAKDSILRFDLTTRAFKILNNGSLQRGVMHLSYIVVDDDLANKQ